MLADGVIKKNLFMLDEIASKTQYKDKESDRVSKTMNGSKTLEVRHWTLK